MKFADTIALAWFAFWNVIAFLAFGFDKWRAGRGAKRISEFTLVALAALGGWPGGWLGMILFRHKTAKWTFKFKFAIALVLFAAEIWLWQHFR